MQKDRRQLIETEFGQSEYMKQLDRKREAQVADMNNKQSEKQTYDEKKRKDQIEDQRQQLKKQRKQMDYMQEMTKQIKQTTDARRQID